MEYIDDEKLRRLEDVDDERLRRQIEELDAIPEPAPCADCLRENRKYNRRVSAIHAKYARA